MHRLSNGTQANALMAPPPVIGTPGYPIGANPAGGQQAAIIDAWQATSIQEELAGLVEATGVALDKTNDTQVLRAVSVIGNRFALFGTSATWVVPAGVYMIRVRLYAGGGGGGFGNFGGGGGGAGGGYAEGTFPVTPGDTLVIIIGAGGAGGTSGAAAANGGASSLSDSAAVLCSATPGGAGAQGTANGLGPGGTAGVGSGAPRVTYGSVGGAGSATSSVIMGGVGGNALAYQGGPGILLAAGNNEPGNNAQTGSGGGGGIGTGNGGNGGSGLLILEY